MTKENDFSVDKVANSLEKLAKQIRSKKQALDLVNRGMRGDGRENYDFTGASRFFREDYPDLKKLFYEIRGKGILNGYIKKED
ncbi:MAG: hypothetical protein PVJ67_05625 [Candidatus Pacearchaeota archaeon]|jgi:hypothetical protein